VVFCGNCSTDPEVVFGNLDTAGPPPGGAPLPDGFRLEAQGVLTGRARLAAGGRDEVVDGVFDGSLSLSLEGDDEPDRRGICLSSLHSFSLQPR
jgi:hypothetical protein